MACKKNKIAKSMAKKYTGKGGMTPMPMRPGTGSQMRTLPFDPSVGIPEMKTLPYVPPRLSPKPPVDFKKNPLGPATGPMAQELQKLQQELRQKSQEQMQKGLTPPSGKAQLRDMLKKYRLTGKL